MRKTLFYIAGYGRSGSTLLDMSMSSKFKCISIGAFSNFIRWKNHNYLCACGRKLSDCQIWSQVIDTLNRKNFPFDNFLDDQILFDSRKAFFVRHFLSFLYHSRYKNYLSMLNLLYSTIFDVTGSSVIIESSKTSSDTANRFYNISRALDINLCYLHLFRDPRGTCSSVLSRPGSPERSFSYNSKIILLFSSINGWLQSNFYALFPGVKDVKREFIDYASFCKKPESSLNRIFVRSSILPSHLNTSDLRHNLGGNRLRFLEIDEIKEDISWKLNLSFSQLFLINCLLPVYKVLQLLPK